MEELRRKERGGLGLEGIGEKNTHKTTHICTHRASTLPSLWKHKGASLPDFIKVN